MIGNIHLWTGNCCCSIFWWATACKVCWGQDRSVYLEKLWSQHLHLFTINYSPKIMVFWLLHGVMTQKSIYMAMPAMLALKLQSSSSLMTVLNIGFLITWAPKQV